MLRKCFLLIGMALTGAVVGCDTGVQEEEIVVKASNDPLNMPRSVLQRYAEGQPLGSEVTSFPHMVESVRAVDPERAAILEEGLQKLQDAPATSRPAVAKELLQKIQPSMTAPPVEDA